MTTLIQKFLEQAGKRPNHAAALDIHGAYTYAQLNRRSAYLAERILKLLSDEGKRRGRIALLLPRTKEYLAALLAVLRAGCAAVPMDAEYPAERVRAMLEDVGCSLCVTKTGNRMWAVSSACSWRMCFPRARTCPKRMKRWTFPTWTRKV